MEIIVLYFDILPLDINLVILSNLNLTDIESFSLIRYKYRKMLLNDEAWKNIFMISYPKEYKFIISVKNVDGSATWKELMKFYDEDRLRYVTGYNANYLEDMYYLNLIYIKYPKFYEQIKDINLSHLGMGTNKDGIKSSNWHRKYFILKNITGKSKFVNGDFSRAQFAIVLDSLLLSSLVKTISIPNQDLYYYIYYKNNIKSVSIETLYVFYRTNLDMYDNLFDYSMTSDASWGNLGSKLTFKKYLTDLDYDKFYIDILKAENRIASPEYLIKLFISDIKEKLSS